ncbi:MAG: orotidine-5'-phosphate decarboxylase [Propionibacteriaceae bacterium]|nr:orotidine-5'-phosphate decarboxylase [Propionibacteriaceae bacterium]
MVKVSFRSRLDATVAARGNACVGIDPMPSVLDAWGVSHDAAGVEKVARGIVEVLGERAAVFKPQSAFFEPFGAEGIRVLERVLADIAEAGALSILDVKRGDIGSSMRGYAEAYLVDDAPLAADAITVSPYLGVGALTPAFELAHDNGRGVYVLARTSNPDGGDIQTAHTREGSVAQHVLDTLTELNPSLDGLLGVVLGATQTDLGCDPSRFNGSILAPGIGAQGATMASLEGVFGATYSSVLPTASRQVIGGGSAELMARFANLFFV